MTAFSSPYPGLRPFGAEEADLFFGREEQVDELLRRLHSTRFLAVVGPSGCGKSSLVRAGMIAALESGFLVSAGSLWQFAVMRPGGRPMSALATALAEQTSLASDDIDKPTAIGLLGATLRRGPLGLVEALRDTPLPENTSLLVLIDQFEEIFRFRREGGVDEADAFVSLLLESAQQREAPIYVVLTMRSDFFGDCAAFAGLPEALNRSQYLTPRLSREQRRAAIAGPARVFGGDVAPDLVNRLLNEMGNDPDQLPLMQHLLMRMWTWRTPGQADTGRTLTIEDYEAVGGLRHALSNHANEAFDHLDDRQKLIAETLFRRLSERAPGSRDIRRPTPAGEVVELAGATRAELTDVADVFRAPGCSFVVPQWPQPLDNDTILDITHEALIRQWDRLRGWADDEAESADRYRFLERNAQLWKQGHMAFWGTPNLEMALDWRERIHPTELWARRYGGDFALAMQFLDASAQARVAELDAQRLQRQRQVRRLRRVTMASMASALLCIGALGSVYWFGFAEHVAYYSNYTKRWGEPVGIDALNADQVRHRYWSLKFIERGIHYDPQSPWRFTYTVNQIEAVDADGNCMPDNEIGTYLSESNEDFSSNHECVWRFVRDATSGRIVYENAYDKDGNMRWGYEYLPGASDRHHREAYYVGASGSLAHFRKSPASVIHMTYSDRGYEVLDTYFDRDGNPQSGPDHAYGRKFEYDLDGRRLSMTSVDASGNNVNDTAGNATLLMRYDSAGNEVDNQALDAVGKATLFKEGYHEARTTFDQYGNVIDWAFFDNDGQLGLNQNGVHEIRLTRDDKGDVRRSEYFDRDGKPSISTNGYHRVDVGGLGPYGQWSDWAYYDAEGRRTTDSHGAHRYVETFDANGLVLSNRAFGTDLHPVAAIEGCYELRYGNNTEGNADWETCYDSDGRAALNESGAHKVTFRYDDRGNIVERKYFGRDGSPITIGEGYHHRTAKYDLFGNLEDEAYFDIDDHPVSSTEGYQRSTGTYDGRGNQTSLAYYDPDGNLVAGPKGFAKRTTKYDNRDNPVEKDYYGPDGELTEASKEATGYATIRQRFDDRWRLVESAYFDRYGNPAALSDGAVILRSTYTGEFEDQREFDATGRAISYKGCAIFRETIARMAGNIRATFCLDADGQNIADADGVSIVRTKYDDQGNVVETAYADGSGKSTLGPDHVAFIRNRYDNAGHNTEVSYYGVNQEPVLGPDGTASIRAKYDTVGHRIEASYHDVRGGLLVGPYGYAIVRQRFDDHGNLIDVAYFGTDNRPVATPDGFHRQSLHYDERGHITERTVYGENDQPVALPSGQAIRRTQYDDHGRIIDDAYFGPDGQPVVTSDGYHRLSTRYDERGDIIETAYYGADEKPLLESKEGYAVRRAKYDDHGRLTEEAYFGPDGKPIAMDGRYYHSVLQYSDAGGGIEQTFYDTDDKLAQPAAKGFAMSRSEQVLYRPDGHLVAHCLSGSTDSVEPPSHCLDAEGHPLTLRIVVLRLVPDSQAVAVGMRPGDVLESYEGQQLRQEDDLRHLTSDTSGGARKLVIRRGGRLVELTVQPGRLGIYMGMEFISDAAMEPAK